MCGRSGDAQRMTPLPRSRKRYATGVSACSSRRRRCEAAAAEVGARPGRAPYSAPPPQADDKWGGDEASFASGSIIAAPARTGGQLPT
jgi:hypothetical protein